MNKLFLAFLFTVVSLSAIAQHKEGYIKYTAQVFVQDTTPETLQVAQLLRGSRMEVYVTRNRYRLDSDLGPFGKSTMICDVEIGKTLVLSSTSMGNYAQIMNRKVGMKTPDPTILPEIDKSRKKTILGFDCYPVVAVGKKDSKSYWVTTGIDFKVEGRSVMGENLPGFPMIIEETKDGFKFRFTASNFTDYVENESEIMSLELPEGYTLIPDK